MARKPRERSRKQRAAENNGPAADNAGMNGEAPGSRRLARMGSDRGRIIEAFMDLLAEQPIEEIGFPDIAERAGVSLADLRGEFGSRMAILSAHIKEIDREVLAADSTDMAEEGPRERLFDVLMRRLEAQEPYKDQSPAAALARRNPAPRLRTQRPRHALAALDAGGRRDRAPAPSVPPARRTGAALWAGLDDLHR
ncbi:MAG: hypothetical protein R3D62_03405 [Xanthobacteraceae bacterium]